jgi:hypothetical protein
VQSGLAVKPYEKGLTMNATQSRFVRRTTLREDEYRTNFRQLDRDAIELLKSAEARRVTHLMAALYLTLVDAPPEYWEREGVLRFTGEDGEGGPSTAWRQLVVLLGCGNTTAKKALDWMHVQGLVGYYAGKNGAGIRIFINRAVTSIGRRGGQKNLRLVRAPVQESPTPAAGTPFNDSFAVSEVLETDINPRAPKNGAETEPVGKTSSASTRKPIPIARTSHSREEGEQSTGPRVASTVSVEEVVGRLRSELESCVREIAARAAAQSASREMERTREWFETKALPKAVRVAQHETYDLLRKHGGVEGRRGQGSAGLEVGCSAGDYTAVAARPLTAEEVRETAEVCVALLETQGKSIEVTLSEISSEGGGLLLPEDAPRVREAARELALSWGKGENG